jgi:hypothetical protein
VAGFGLLWERLSASIIAARTPLSRGMEFLIRDQQTSMVAAVRPPCVSSYIKEGPRSWVRFYAIKNLGISAFMKQPREGNCIG